MEKEKAAMRDSREFKSSKESMIKNAHSMLSDVKTDSDVIELRTSLDSMFNSIHDKAGLTDEETDLTADLLKSLAGDHTVLVIEHDMEFIRRLDSPVTVLHQGHVLCEGTMDQVQVDPRVIEVYLGTTEDDSK